MDGQQSSYWLGSTEGSLLFGEAMKNHLLWKMTDDIIMAVTVLM